MSEQNLKKGIMAKDTVFYMLAKLLEGVIGVLTISFMSYIYLPEQIGKYSAINVFVTTVAMVFIQWLVQSSLRYINKYDIENKNSEFYSTIFYAWFKVNAFAFILFFLFIFIFKLLFLDFFESYSLSLVFFAFVMFLTYNTSQLIVAILAGARKVKVNLFLSITNALGKLVFIIAFNKLISVKIEWIFLSYIIFDALTVIVGVKTLKIFKYLNKKNNSKETLQTLKNYGMPLMGNMFATSVLNKSDIYIISFFLGDGLTGIYQTNYSIIASAFTVLNMGIMRGSYPTIVRTWSEGKVDLTKKLISDSVRFFLIISIPAVVGIFCLSNFIAISFFDIKYVSGSNIMGVVALGMMFLGLTEYCIKPWELNAKTKAIFKRSMFCGVFNVFINILFIKTFGYKFASISTFISYFIYFVLAKLGTKKYIKWEIKKTVYFNILLSAFIMAVVILFVKHFLYANLLSLVALVLLGVFIYVFMLYIIGEIKDEINLIFNKILKRT